MSTVPYRVGKWLPSDQAVLDSWLDKLIKEVDSIDHVNAGDVDIDTAEIDGLHPVIQEFKELIDGDAEVNMFFHQMFLEVPKKHRHRNPADGPQVKNYHHMLRLINHIMTKAPEYNSTGLVGFPINAILDWSMGTNAGLAAFLNTKVNLHLKKILNHWGSFLKSPESCYVLNKDPKTGWLGKDALKHMPNFVEDFVCDPNEPHFGFKSWDDFFTRQFREGVRPIASPDDNKVIVNACESAPYKIQLNVKLRDKFWIKSQRYSLGFMMANDDQVEKFVGGTVYQAFLSALSYHCWHSPVDGTIVKTHVVDGSYYAEAQSKGFDPSGPNKSQGYISEVATRGLVFIRADNPYIGLMCFIAIGMAEVSSCDITVKEGDRVKKGQQIGMFHFGGSTHALIFRPGVDVHFVLRDQPGLHANNIPVNARLATVPC